MAANIGPETKRARSPAAEQRPSKVACIAAAPSSASGVLQGPALGHTGSDGGSGGVLDPRRKVVHLQAPPAAQNPTPAAVVTMHKLCVLGAPTEASELPQRPEQAQQPPSPRPPQPPGQPQQPQIPQQQKLSALRAKETAESPAGRQAALRQPKHTVHDADTLTTLHTEKGQSLFPLECGLGCGRRVSLSAAPVPPSSNVPPVGPPQAQFLHLPPDLDFTDLNEPDALPQRSEPRGKPQRTRRRPPAAPRLSVPARPSPQPGHPPRRDLTAQCIQPAIKIEPDSLRPNTSSFLTSNTCSRLMVALGAETPPVVTYTAAPQVSPPSLKVLSLPVGPSPLRKPLSKVPPWAVPSLNDLQRAYLQIYSTSVTDPDQRQASIRLIHQLGAARNANLRAGLHHLDCAMRCFDPSTLAGALSREEAELALRIPFTAAMMGSAEDGTADDIGVRQQQVCKLLGAAKEVAAPAGAAVEVQNLIAGSEGDLAAEAQELQYRHQTAALRALQQVEEGQRTELQVEALMRQEREQAVLLDEERRRLRQENALLRAHLTHVAQYMYQIQISGVAGLGGVDVDGSV